ncbi:protein kinase, partial [bacterium]|nr:protein kinase [bacterium]
MEFVKFLEAIVQVSIMIILFIYIIKNIKNIKALIDMIKINFLISNKNWEGLYEFKGSNIDRFEFIPNETILEMYIQNKKDDQILKIGRKISSKKKDIHLLENIVDYFEERGKPRETMIFLELLLPHQKDNPLFLRKAADIYEENDSNKYMEIIELLHAENPGDIDCAKELAELYEKNFKISNAIKIYQVLANVDTSNHLEYIKHIAELHFKSFNYNEAVVMLWELAKNDPSTLDILINYLIKFFKHPETEKDYILLGKIIDNFCSESEEHFNKFMKIYDEMAGISEVMEIYGKFFLKFGDIDKAEIAFAAIIKTDSSIDNLYTLANIYSVKNKLNEAIEIYENILETNDEEFEKIYEKVFKIYKKSDGNDKIFRFYVKLLKKKQNFPKLVEVLEEYSVKNSSDTEIMKLLADSLIQSKQQEKAISILKRLTKLQPDNKKNFEKLVSLYLFKNDSQNAKNILEELLLIEPNNVEILIKLIDLFTLDEEYEKAAKSYLELLKFDSSNTEWRYNYGEVLMKGGKIDQAIEQFQFVFKNNDNLKFLANLQLGICWLKKGESVISRDIFNSMQIEDLQIEEAAKKEFLYIVGSAFEEEGYFKEAVSFFKKILVLDVGYKNVYAKVNALADKPDQDMTKKRDCVTTKEKKPGATTGFRRIREEGKISERYVDLAELGRGGMGIVYKARDLKLKRSVALKVLCKEYTDDPDIVARFIREAQAVALLNHPNIVSIYDIGDEDVKFLSMEFIDGHTLRKILKQKKVIPISQVIRIMGQILDAMEYAHTKGIIHRDIKPDNIMITREGVIKIMDFGLAKIENALPLTDSGVVMGTEWYMSPEQIKGYPGDRRTDIYALGIVLYEMTAGKVPFSSGDISFQHINVKPEPPSKLNPNIPAKLENIILKCIQKKTTARYGSSKEILEDLKKVAAAGSKKKGK